MSNVNDNGGTRPWIYNTRGDGKINEDMARFIPVATYILEKYAPEEWRLDPDRIKYSACEYTICLHLNHADKENRNSFINAIAHLLGVNPIPLLNDPDFPI